MLPDLHAIERQCLHITALPSNRISGFNYVMGDEENDTAWYNTKDQRITITQRLLDNIAAVAPASTMAALKAVLYHEAGHSIITKYWPEDPTPTQHAMMNWLEDYRLNHWLLTGNPDLREGFAATYAAVTHGRTERPPASPPDEVMRFLSNLSKRSIHGGVAVQYEYLMAATDLSAPARQALRNIQPDVIEFVAKTPDAYDAAVTAHASLESLQVAERIFKKLEPLFSWEQERQAMEAAQQAGQQLKDAVEKELERRGARSGQPQPGPDEPTTAAAAKAGLEGLTTEQLKALKEVLEAVEQMPNAGAQPDATAIKGADIPSELKAVGGYSPASAKDAKLAKEAVGAAEYTAFYARYHRIIAEAERAFANQDAHVDPQGRTRLSNSSSGPVLHTRNAARMVLTPPTTLPPLFRRPHLQAITGEKEWKLDKLYFAVDGSSSMREHMGFVRFFLGVVYEAARKAKIPAATVVAYDGAPHIISKGNPSDQPGDVIRRILAIHPVGSTNVSEGALKQMFELCGVARATAGRLVMVTDCETSAADLQMIDKWSRQLGFPAAIVSPGNKSFIEQAAAQFRNGPVLGYDRAHIDSAMPRFMAEFAHWMREPLSYVMKHPPGRARLFSEFQHESPPRAFSAARMSID